MYRLSYPTDTVLSNKNTRNRIFLSFIQSYGNHLDYDLMSNHHSSTMQRDFFQLLERIFKLGGGGLLCAALAIYTFTDGRSRGITSRFGGVGAGFATFAAKLSSRLK